MTQSPNDRLDRIESALDRQVAVNGDLRTSVEILNNTVQSLQVSVADLRFSVDAILATVQQHQQNFEAIAQELRSQRAEITQLQESQRTTNTTLDRISTILEFLVQEQNRWQV